MSTRQHPAFNNGVPSLWAVPPSMAVIGRWAARRCESRVDPDVRGHRVRPLGVEHFGQSGDLPELCHHYRLDVDAILDGCAAASLG